MAEEFKVLVGAELKSDAIQGIRDQINGIPTINLKMNTGRVRSQLTNIRKQIEKLSGIKITLTDGSSGGSGNSGKRIQNTVNNMNIAYKQMLNMQKKIGSIKLQIGGLDSGKNSSQIAELSKQLRQLEDDYKFIQQTFSQSNLSTDQWIKLQTVISSTGEKLDVLKSKIADSSASEQQKVETQKIKAAYDELLRIIKEIGSIKVKIGGLDSQRNASEITTLTNQLDELQNKYNNIRQTFDQQFNKTQLDGLQEALQRVSNSVDTVHSRMADTTAVKQSQAAIQQTETAYRELINVSKQINNLELKIGGLNGTANSNEIAVLKNQLNELRQTYQQSANSLQGQLSATQLANLSGLIDDAKNKLAQLDAKVVDTKAKLASEIQIKLDNGTFNNDISKIDASLAKIKTQSMGVTQSMTELNSALTTIQTARASNDVDGLIRGYEQYEAALKKVKNQIDINLRAEKQAAKQSNDTAKLNIAKQELATDMDVWLKNNSAAAKQFGGQIEYLKAQINSCDAAQLDGLKAQFKEVTRQAELAGKATLSFSDRLKEQMSKLGTYFSASMMITQGIRAMQSMYDNVVDVDTAMTGLYRVTDLTSEQYAKLYDNMISSAKQYGSTLSDIITSTADWVRLGFDSSTANRLSEITAMYQHISDLDNGTAVNNLVTAYKGFQDQLLNLYSGDSAAAIEYVADIFNELGNKYAVSAEDVGAALTNSASALNLAGNTIQQTAAMATGITEVTQDPEKAGNSLKVLSLRLRGMKGELQELGEEVDENVESLSKMQTQILNLTDGKVNIFNDDGSFKSTYEIMDDIAEVYNSLDPTKQADLLETIAGKNRANDVAALLSNWEQVEAAMQSAMEAEGSASAENEKYMESIQGHLDALTASWQALSNSIIDSDFVSGLLDGITALISGLDTVVDKAGLLPTLLTGISVAMSFKNVGELIKQFHYPITLGNEYAHKALY